MEELKAIFASNLIKLRAAAGMTQAELGEILHYSDKSISKWERAEAIPDAYVLTRMAEAFGVTVNDLLTSDTAWKPPVDSPPPVTYSRPFVILCSIAGIWTLSLIEFALLWILGGVHWMLLLLAVPLSLIVLLVFNSIWYGGRRNMYIIAALVLSVVVLLYLQFHWWQVFLVLPPAELVVYLACNIRKKRRV